MTQKRRTDANERLADAVRQWRSQPATDRLSLTLSLFSEAHTCRERADARLGSDDKAMAAILLAAATLLEAAGDQDVG